MTGVHLYLRLLQYVRPYWWAFGLAVLGMVVVAGGDLVMAMLVIPIVNNFQNPDPVRTQWLPLAVIAVFVLRGLGSFVSEYGMAYTGHRVVFDLRCALVDKLLRLPTAYYDVTPSGVVQSRLTFDAHQLASAASGTITTAIRSSLTIAVSIGWLLWINWRLTLMTFFVLPIVAVVTRYFSRRLRRIARDVQNRTGSMTHVLEEMIGGHRIVRIFGGERYERARAVRAANSLRTSMTKQSSAGAASSPITQTLAALAVGMIIWFALGQSESGRLDLGTFASYIVMLFALLDRLKSLSGINAAVQRGLAAAESLFGLLDREAEPDHGNVTLERARGELRFDHLFLKYNGSDNDAIADITLTIRPGETVALVGSSGSGKTSLVSVIPRFYEPTAGRLFIDGHDITTLTLASLRAQIALVTQDVLLFDDTIAANIAYGAMSGIPADAVERAAAAAHALEFIRALPQGFDTQVGENGVRLSGGQRQRVAIARAFLKDAPVLILDEATSHLDAVNEQAVRGALDRLQADRTTIVIAHRLSTVRDADRIVVLDEGRVAEIGTHDALLAKGGLYAQLVSRQLAAAYAPAAQ